MADYMVIILENEAELKQLTPSEAKALIEAHSAYAKMLKASGSYRDGERLRPSVEGKRVSVRDGQVRVGEGPFDETARALGGYYVVQAESLEDAVRLASTCPVAPGTAIDVRPLVKGNVRPNKTNLQGHVFAFAVLGKAPNEEAWIDLMERIDADTRDCFPKDLSLGGVRLQAPSSGRRVMSTAGKRSIIDGPFLESKEVIGGLFFMRMATMEDAVHWAGTTKFVEHGALEIRELWRS